MFLARKYYSAAFSMINSRDARDRQVVCSLYAANIRGRDSRVRATGPNSITRSPSAAQQFIFSAPNSPMSRNRSRERKAGARVTTLKFVRGTRLFFFYFLMGTGNTLLKRLILEWPISYNRLTKYTLIVSGPSTNLLRWWFLFYLTRWYSLADLYEGTNEIYIVCRKSR